MISTIVFAWDLYSTSVLDRDIVACFLELQEIELDLRKIANPPVDLRSLGHPAQSASEKPLRIMDEDLTKFMPC
jgi:hypothetical protein